MKYLITIIACVVAVSYIPVAFGMPYVPMIPPYGPSYNEGGGYLNEGYGHGGSTNYGGGNRRQGSNMFYDEGDNYHRSTQVTENEGRSRHNIGGGSQGSSAGGSYGNSNMFGRGNLNTGGGYSNYGPRMFI